MSDRAPSPAPADVFMTQQEPDAKIQVEEVEPIHLPSPTASVKVKEVEPIPLLSPTAHVKVKEVEPIPLLSHTVGVKAEASYASVSTFGSRKMHSAVERRTILEDDPQVEEVEPHRVMCRYCQKWIKLSLQTTYSAGNWEVHKLRCGEQSLIHQKLRRAPSKSALNPSSRVATAERKIVLLNDPQVRECSPRHVLCNTCRTVVVLESELNYNLVSWSAHKEKCIPRTPAPITTHERASRRAYAFPTPSTSSTDSHVSVGGSRRSPTPDEDSGSNIQSRETTATVKRSPTGGVKRGRKEDVEAQEDVRPRNRPRKETYEPPEEDARNVLEWFLLPFQNLTRGFREGVGFT